MIYRNISRCLLLDFKFMFKVAVRDYFHENDIRVFIRFCGDLRNYHTLMRIPYVPFCLSRFRYKQLSWFEFKLLSTDKTVFSMNTFLPAVALYIKSSIRGRSFKLMLTRWSYKSVGTLNQSFDWAHQQLVTSCKALAARVNSDKNDLPWKSFPCSWIKFSKSFSEWL